MDILGTQAHPMAQLLFPNNDTIFQDDLPIHTARSVQSWFEEHENALQHLWPAQSPNLNIIEPLWSVLKSRVRNRFPPSSLKQLEEKWYSIPVETI
jgi:transposase